jgi:hypothetical protein
LEAIEMKRAVIEIEELRLAFNYDPETGALIWKHREGMPAKRNTRYAGTRAGSVHLSGYRKIKFQGRMLWEHRIVWAIAHGRWPADQIDHINGVKGDNRLANLREANNSQNGANRTTQKNNKSGLKGVAWDGRVNKWFARIRKNGQPLHLGMFETPEAAHASYVEAAQKLHGQFANAGDLST